MKSCWRISIFHFVLLAAVALVAYGQSQTTSSPAGSLWTLVWKDEFDGANGSAPDSSKWNLETGGDGWGNHELEYYTSRLQNAQIQNGSLVITASKETYTGTNGVTRNYTSARMKTAGKFEQQYGRFEARIKIPYGQGMWPAFWMLGNNSGPVGWPGSGPRPAPRRRSSSRFRARSAVRVRRPPPRHRLLRAA